MNILQTSNFDWQSKNNVDWAETQDVTEGKSQLCAMRLPAGAYQPPHVLPDTTRTIFVTRSGGAQIQIGSRVFRPLAGQTFVVEAGVAFAQTNDTEHPFVAMVLLQGDTPNQEPIWLTSEEE